MRPTPSKPPVSPALSTPGQSTPGLEALWGPDPPPRVVSPDGSIYHSTSLCVLRPHHWPRRLAIEIIEHNFFEPFIAVTILCNVVTMAWQSPLDPEGTWKADFIAVCEAVFLAIFTVELVLKVVAMGFLLHRHSYLRDVWCQLDFVVVSLAWVPIFLPSFSTVNQTEAEAGKDALYQRRDPDFIEWDDAQRARERCSSSSCLPRCRR